MSPRLTGTDRAWRCCYALHHALRNYRGGRQARNVRLILLWFRNIGAARTSVRGRAAAASMTEPVPRNRATTTLPEASEHQVLSDPLALIAELRNSKLSERQGRLIDGERGDSMEAKKIEGYF